MWSRRRFVAAVGSGVGLGGSAWPLWAPASFGGTDISSSQRRWLLAVLPRDDPRYDPFARMLVTSGPGGPPDRSTLSSRDVHATRNSLAYAAALLDTGVDWRLERAKEILRAVITLQDPDPESRTYGLWPSCLEAPIAKPMANLSPPDWDGAAFCGVALLMTWLGHRERLGAALAQSVREAILHAARSIQRRDQGPEDTHPAIAGTGVVLLTAQEFKLPELRAYGKDRLRRLHDHVRQQGSFAEYNSPTCTTLALQELSRMLCLVKDARDRVWISALHDLTWKHAVTHFHPPTQQWAGPHSRCSETDLRQQPATLAFLQAASAGKIHFNLRAPLPLSLEAYRLSLQCPRKWIRHLGQLEAPRQVVENFVQADPARPGWKNPVTGTTWLHPKLALGSVSRGDFWAQRRPLLAYWGTANAPRFLRVRFLKNDFDFASALLFTAQQESAVLAVVVFATDYGDTHPTLDLIQNATIRAKDLRLRFEVGGSASGFTVRTAGESKNGLLLQDPDVRWILRPVADGFDGTPFRWDQPELKLSDRVDAVAYAGAEKSLNLSSLNEAFVCFALEEWPYEQKRMTAGEVEVQRADGRLRARWSTRGKILELEVPVQPGPYASLSDSFRSSVIVGG